MKTDSCFFLSECFLSPHCNVGCCVFSRGHHVVLMWLPVAEDNHTTRANEHPGHRTVWQQGPVYRVPLHTVPIPIPYHTITNPVPAVSYPKPSPMSMTNHCFWGGEGLKMSFHHHPLHTVPIPMPYHTIPWKYQQCHSPNHHRYEEPTIVSLFPQYPTVFPVHNDSFSGRGTLPSSCFCSFVRIRWSFQKSLLELCWQHCVQILLNHHWPNRKSQACVAKCFVPRIPFLRRTKLVLMKNNTFYFFLFICLFFVCFACFLLLFFGFRMFQIAQVWYSATHCPLLWATIRPHKSLLWGGWSSKTFRENTQKAMVHVTRPLINKCCAPTSEMPREAWRCSQGVERLSLWGNSPWWCCFQVLWREESKHTSCLFHPGNTCCYWYRHCCFPCIEHWLEIQVAVLNFLKTFICVFVTQSREKKIGN